MIIQPPGCAPYELRALSTVRPQVSASQIDMFEGLCARRGAFRYFSKLPKPPTHPSAAKGSALHAYGEGYLRSGTKPDLTDPAGELFVAGLPYLPPPGSGGVEGEYALKVGGIEYALFIDYRGPGVPGINGRVVLDHKTSSNPTAYGLWTPEAFLANPQAVIYSTADLIDTGDQDVRLRWLYYWTKGRPRAKPSDAYFRRAQIEDVYHKVVHEPAREIVRLKTLPAGYCDPNTVEPDTTACEKYPVSKALREAGHKAGCPYKDYCHLIPSDYTRGALKGFNHNTTGERPMQDLLSKMTAGLNGGAQQPAPQGQLPMTHALPPQAAPQYQPNQTTPPFAPAPGQGQDHINPPETYAPVNVQQPPTQALPQAAPQVAPPAAPVVTPDPGPTAPASGTSHDTRLILGVLAESFKAIGSGCHKAAEICARFGATLG